MKKYRNVFKSNQRTYLLKQEQKKTKFLLLKENKYVYFNVLC